MHQVYLLLRNNKQSGPYTLDELRRQSLQPLDLVWVEGKSAGWRNPGEIDGLTIPGEPALGPAQAPPPSPEVLSTPLAKQPPKKIYVRLPGGQSPLVTADPSPADLLQKKADALYQRVQNWQSEKKASGSEIGTKYTRSLDDIKQEYADWLQRRKSSRHFEVRKYLPAVGLLLLAAAALVSFRYFSAPGTLAAVQQDSPTPVADEAAPVLPQPKTAAVKNPKKVPLHKKTSSPVTVSSKKNKASAPVIKNTTGGEAKSAATALPQLIRITGNYKPLLKGVSESAVTVRNNSKEFLRVVAVDVFYYLPDGKEASRQTLYFRELAPGVSMTLTAPSNKKADDVRYKLGLISSREGGIYYAMQ